MRRFAAVTTCHAKGYELYGRRMAASFERHWPADVDLYLYAEGFAPDVPSRRIVPLDLLATCPALVAFKERHRHNPLAHGAEVRRRLEFRVRWRKRKVRLRLAKWGLGFRWDAVRFSHKAFSIFDAAERVEADVLFWLDADTVFFRDLPPSFLEELMPPECLVSYLARYNVSECGLVGYNLRHPAICDFLGAFKALYTTDRLFRENEYHDSYLFDIVRRRFERRGSRTHDIGEGVGLHASHVLINSKLGSYMDHVKGGRKEYGSSPRGELLVERNEDYWTSRAPRSTREGNERVPASPLPSRRS